jgi:hypothetical protein
MHLTRPFCPFYSDASVSNDGDWSHMPAHDMHAMRGTLVIYKPMKGMPMKGMS